MFWISGWQKSSQKRLLNQDTLLKMFGIDCVGGWEAECECATWLLNLINIWMSTCLLLLLVFPTRFILRKSVNVVYNRVLLIWHQMSGIEPRQSSWGREQSRKAKKFCSCSTDFVNLCRSIIKNLWWFLLRTKESTEKLLIFLSFADLSVRPSWALSGS